MTNQNPIGNAIKRKEPFQLLESLGVGGFAHTYKAKVLNEADQKEWGEIVAVKIPLTKEKEGALIQDLIMAGSVHTSLLTIGRTSPNIVKYYGFTQFDGNWVMISEFISGGNLRNRIGDIDFQQPMNIDDACNIVDGILDGLTVLHAAHIVHRDIKPENILMDGNTPKITDFGLSRILSSHDRALSGAGALLYMSPESLTSTASFNTDIWSLSVTFYEMLSGELPFGGRRVRMLPEGALIRKILDEPPQSLPRIPPKLWAVVERGLKKDPKDRYQTASEMRDALRQCRIPDMDEFGQRMASFRESISDRLPDDVENELLTFVQRYPKDSRAYLNLGEFYLKAGRLTDAVNFLRKGLAWDAKNALIYWNLSQVYQKQGNRKAARDALKHASGIGLEKSLQRYAEILLRALEADE